MSILAKMEPLLLKACFDLYGIHPVQAFLSSNITVEEETIIRKAVKGELINLSIVKC